MKRYSHAIFTAAGILLALFLTVRIVGIFVNNSGNAVASSNDEPVLTASGALGGNQKNETVSQSGAYRRVASTPVPEVKVHAALIADPINGEVLFNLNPNTRWPIASLTKLMTATIIKENMSMSSFITLEESDFEGGGNSLTAALVPGDTYRADELLKIMLVSSSNEAAEAFARTYGRDRFLEAMNAEAVAWGLSNTHFADPSGISIGNQSTPLEFKELAIRVWRLHPELFAITRMSAVTVTEWRSGGSKTFENTNHFVTRADFLGGKTGTTPEAGENLLTLFSYRSHPVMILVFGSENRFEDTEQLYSWFTHDFSPSN